jgi:centromere protein J
MIFDIDRHNIQEKWLQIQQEELELLQNFIDLESCLTEELDSLVLLSQDSSDVEVPNFIETLFTKKVKPATILKDTVKVTTVQEKDTVKDTMVQEKDTVKKTAQDVKENDKCKKECIKEIQNLKKEISRLNQELKKKREEEVEFKEKIEKNALKEIQKKEKEWENLRKCSILPSRKERIEVENLKKLNLKEKEEFKQKEIRLLLAQDRFKRRIEELSNRNSELLEEVKVLERDRANYLPSKCKNVGIQTENQGVKSVCKEAVVALSSLATVLELDEPLDTIVYPTKKVEYVYDQVKLVWYPNGTLKENYFSGKQVIYFVNGDKKTILEDGITLYWYAQPDILHTTLPNGLEVFEFSNGQIEKRYKDGTLEIHFPDSTIKYVYADGQVFYFVKYVRKKYSFRMEQ